MTARTRRIGPGGHITWKIPKVLRTLVRLIDPILRLTPSDTADKDLISAAIGVALVIHRAFDKNVSFEHMIPGRIQPAADREESDFRTSIETAD